MEDWLKYVEVGETKPIDRLVTKCLICEADIPVYSRCDAPKICGYCKEAVIWARKKMEQGERLYDRHNTRKNNETIS